MKRFKNISLIYECDLPTLERASLLAKDNRARLTIVHPIKEIPAKLTALSRVAFALNRFRNLTV